MMFLVLSMVDSAADAAIATADIQTYHHNAANNTNTKAVKIKERININMSHVTFLILLYNALCKLFVLS
jgi:hypothetical protein